MEVSAANISKFDDEENALKVLLGAFGSLFSLEEIASAYCKAGRDADLAGQLLINKQGITSTSSSNVLGAETRDEEYTEVSSSNISEISYHENGKWRTSKQKGRPVSGGTVSSVLGKNYIKSIPVANGACKATKPLKLDAKELPMSDLWGAETEVNVSKNDNLHKDMEDFLFNMLGDGFQLERNMIHEVLDRCGYDMQKSMEKLLDLSALTLEKKNNYLGKSSGEFTDKCSNSQGTSCEKKLQPMNSHGGAKRVLNSNGVELPRQEKVRNDLQKEVLASLFTSIDRAEALNRRSVRAARRTMVLGEPVVEPPTDSREYEPDSVDLLSQQDDKNDKDQDDDYLLVLKAVMENRETMKHYYTAAIDAFVKGDHDQANKLMNKGNFYNEKAREAGEESYRKIFEFKNAETQDDMLINLHNLDAKAAIRLLKCQLPSLCGMPSIKHLRLVIDTEGKDITRGARRRWVIKLLGRESISWTETEVAGTILARVDNVNPKCLSFVKK